jgi:hypothetical protein
MRNLELLEEDDPDKLQTLLSRQEEVSVLCSWMRSVVSTADEPVDPDSLTVEEGLPLVQKDVALHGVLYVETLLLGKVLLSDRRLLERMTANEATSILVRYGLTVAIPSHLHNEFMQKVRPQDTVLRHDDWTTLRCVCGAQSVSRLAAEYDASGITYRCSNCREKHRRAKTASGHN